MLCSEYLTYGERPRKSSYEMVGGCGSWLVGTGRPTLSSMVEVYCLQSARSLCPPDVMRSARVSRRAQVDAPLRKHNSSRPDTQPTSAVRSCLPSSSPQSNRNFVASASQPHVKCLPTPTAASRQLIPLMPPLGSTSVSGIAHGHRIAEWLV
jgi:hypothetical protein